MGIGATSVIYLLSKGLSLSDLAVIKLTQGAVIILAEIPTGIVADAFGRKASIKAAILSSMASFLFYLLSDSFWGFLVADLLNALAIAFWSGAFEAFVVDTVGDNRFSEGYLEKVFSRITSFDALATMIGGFVGALLSDRSPVLPFYFSLILGFITFIIAASLLKEERGTIRSSLNTKSELNRFIQLFARLKADLLLSFEMGVGNALLRPFFLVQVFLQFAFQPLLHYWQPYFKGIDYSVSQSQLGGIFFAYVAAQSLISMIVASQIAQKPNWVSKILVVELVLVFTSFLFLSQPQSLAFAITAFLLVQGFGSNLRTLLSVRFNQFIESQHRATILSSVSLVSRFGMLSALGLLQVVLNKISVTQVFWISVLGFAFLLPSIYYWQRSLATLVARGGR